MMFLFQNMRVKVDKGDSTKHQKTTHRVLYIFFSTFSLSLLDTID